GGDDQCPHDYLLSACRHVPNLCGSAWFALSLHTSTPRDITATAVIGRYPRSLQNFQPALPLVANNGGRRDTSTGFVRGNRMEGGGDVWSLALGAVGACIAFAGYTAARKSSDLLHAHSLFRDYLARRVDVQLAGAAADGD